MDLFNLQFILMLALMLSVLVTAHEFGHYWFAKLFGMDVEEFAVGFGRPYWTYMRKNGTDYTLRPIPFGGFVRVKGMVPEEDGSETEIPNGFYSKSPFARFMVLFAGPVFSILAGLAILIPLHSLYGRKEVGTTVDKVLAGKPAQVAGIQHGDKITSIDGKPVVAMFEVIMAVRDKAGEKVTVGFERQGRAMTVTVVPEMEATPSPYLSNPLRPPTGTRRQGKIGLAASITQTVVVKSSISDAVASAVIWPVDMATGLVKTLLRPSTLKDNVGGPGTIVKESYMAAKDGLDSFVQLAALLSISLGIFNLLPFSPLDGGQMLMAVIEMLRRGKRLSMKLQVAYQSLGLAFVLLLVVSVVLIDAQKLFGGSDTPTTPPAPSTPTK